ncbi:MAG: hypothetical protein JWR38_5887 [Mucilaginibacter sp.]|nr:hypothetical protein [Mucilaginibacter sp.]
MRVELPVCPGTFTGGFRNGDIAAGDPVTIHFFYGQFRGSWFPELYKAEPFTFPGVRIFHQLAAGDLAKNFKEVANSGFRQIERKIGNKDFHGSIFFHFHNNIYGVMV